MMRPLISLFRAFVTSAVYVAAYKLASGDTSEVGVANLRQYYAFHLVLYFIAG